MWFLNLYHSLGKFSRQQLDDSQKTGFDNPCKLSFLEKIIKLLNVDDIAESFTEHAKP